MKKLLAALLCVSMLTVHAAAAELEPSESVPAGVETQETNQSGDISLSASPEKPAPHYSITVDNTLKSVTYNTGTPVFYTYGGDRAGSTEEQGGRTARIAIKPRKLDKDGKLISDKYKVTWMTAQAETNNVTVSIARNDGTLSDGREAPVVTIQSNAGPRVCEPQDYAVQVNLTIGELSGKKIINKQDVVLRIEGKESVRYSRVREIENGGRYQISEQTGSTFRLFDEINSRARVACNGQVDVVFQGNYGTDCENLLVETEPIEDVEKKFSDASVQYLNFIGRPKFIKPVELRVSGPEDAAIYRYDIRTGDIERVPSTYQNSAHVVETSELGCFFLSDKML